MRFLAIGAGLALLPALAVPGCASRQHGTETGEHAHRQQRVGGPLAWRVASDSGTVFLLGTIHVGHPAFFPLHPEIEDALDAAELLVLEIDMSVRVALPVGEGARYPEWDSLPNHASPELVEELASRARESGLRWDEMVRLKPWALAALLAHVEYSGSGMSAAHGAEAYMVRRVEGRKPVAALEEAEDHARLLESFSGEDRELLVRWILEDLDGIASTDRLEYLWRAGTIQDIESDLRRRLEGDPRYATIHGLLIDERNARMAAAISVLLRGGQTTFVAVGAAHLVGEGGLLARLRADFRVEPLLGRPGLTAPRDGGG